MSRIIVWSNYEIVNGVKVFGEMTEKVNKVTPKIDGISDFDAAKECLWDAYDEFRNSFNYPIEEGTIYDFSRTEMDLHNEFCDGSEIEGFEYDDSMTMWNATIYENN